MALDKATILAQLDAALRGPDHPNAIQAISPRRDAEETSGTTAHIASMVATVDRFTLPGDHYRASAHNLVDQYGGTNPYTRDALTGVLRALRADAEADRLESLAEQVRSEVFADYLTMAHELQTSGYKDAAAVIAGSTLEEHLRKLSLKAQLPITTQKGDPLKASSMNDALKQTGVYNAVEHRQVQANLDIRNSAAHGNYADYDH